MPSFLVHFRSQKFLIRIVYSFVYDSLFQKLVSKGSLSWVSLELNDKTRQEDSQEFFKHECLVFVNVFFTWMADWTHAKRDLLSNFSFSFRPLIYSLNLMITNESKINYDKRREESEQLYNKRRQSSFLLHLCLREMFFPSLLLRSFSGMSCERN